MTDHAYIHIPFCVKKCNYCAFTSFAAPNFIPKYLETLNNEIQQKYKGENLKTLYFGGGTPSLLTVSQLQSVSDLFNFSENYEITLEINPDTVDEDYFRELKSKTKINRLSIGVQTFDDEKLKLIGRKHDSKKVYECVKFAKSCGFDNISVDLIYGLPSQTIEEVEKDVNKALSLGVQHISLYGLKIETGTIWSHQPPENIPDNDVQASMYEKITEILLNNNFKHYEISNYSLEGFESKHNLSYWKNKNYYGFGLGASGYEGKTRYTNLMTFKQYFENPVNKSYSYENSKQEIIEEEIFLGLRCVEGIDIGAFNEKFGVDFNRKYGDIIKKYQETGHMKAENGRVFLTLEGMLISNEIFSEFIEI